MFGKKSTLTFVLVLLMGAVSAWAQQGCVDPPDGIVSWWPCEGDAMDIIGDNPGRLVSVTFAPGMVGRACSFSGMDSFVEVTSLVDIPIGNSEYAIEGWIKPNAAGNEGILGYGNYGTVNEVNAFRLCSECCFGGYGFRHYWWGNDLDTCFTLMSGTWHHVVAQFDGVARSLYLDGELVALNRPLGHNVPSANNFRIGSTNFGEFFNGLIDELSIYNTALSEEEIQSIIAAGSAGKCRPQ